MLKRLKHSPIRLVISIAGIQTIAVLGVIIHVLIGLKFSVEDLRNDLTFAAQQTRVETLHAMSSLFEFRVDPSPAAYREVVLRYDILWSRFMDLSEPGQFHVAPRDMYDTKELVDEIFSTVRSIETDIAQIEFENDAGHFAAIIDAYRSIGEASEKMLGLVVANDASTKHSLLNREAHRLIVATCLLIGIFISGALSIRLASNRQKNIERLNEQLSLRVDQKTNALAGEIDIRKSAEEAAKTSAERLSQAVELAKVGYFVWDVETCSYLDVSPQHCAAFGVSKEEFLASSKDRDFGGFRTIEKDEKTLEDSNALLFKGNAVQRSYRTQNPSGERWLLEFVNPVCDDFGNITQVRGASMDVTDLRCAEMKLHEATRLESIGHLTGGIAHDFNNLLAVILGNLELTKVDDNIDNTPSYIDEALTAATKGRDLIRNMLSYARRMPLDQKKFCVNDLVLDMQMILRRSIPANIQLTFDLAPEGSMVATDQSMIESALLNLCVNAKDAMPSGGKLIIETRNVSLDVQGHRSSEIDSAGETQIPTNGDFVVLSVTDTGCGISEAEQERIFEPFYSSKSAATNSGLGLAMLQGFAKQAGGDVVVQSKLGEGSKFEVFVPSATPFKKARVRTSVTGTVESNSLSLAV